jgi:glycosyltransferase involved in cell wall biosynthesis
VNPQHQQAVAVHRWGVIAEAANERLSAAERGVLVRELAARAHMHPDGSERSYSRGTIDRWIRAYRSGGLEALAPAPRSDTGVVRELGTAYRIEILSTHPFAVWEQLAWPHAARRDGAAVIHGTANIGPLNWHGAMLLTVHDVIEWHRGREFPSTIPLRHHLSRLYRMNALRRLVASTALILTVSEHARQDIARTLSVDEKNVWVTALAPKISDQEPAYQKEGYFLALGALDPRKNMAGVLSAFSRCLAGDIRLRLVGLEPEALPHANRAIASLGLQDRVEIFEMVSDEQLQELYRRALGFLYLSLYEGFGLPVLDAMALGCPVIAANRTAIPEVAGGAAMLVDPEDPDAVARQIRQLAKDESVRQAMISRGIARCREFQWAKTAEATHAAYELVLAQAQGARG